jgi:hypothetical protein
MTENAANNDTQRPAGQRPDTLAGFLASALDMEDEITAGVYQDYMDMDNWPAGIDLDVFQKIRKHLMVLIKDTRRHQKIISGLIKNHGKDK